MAKQVSALPPFLSVDLSWICFCELEGFSYRISAGGEVRRVMRDTDFVQEKVLWTISPEAEAGINKLLAESGFFKTRKRMHPDMFTLDMPKSSITVVLVNGKRRSDKYDEGEIYDPVLIKLFRKIGELTGINERHPYAWMNV